MLRIEGLKKQKVLRCGAGRHRLLVLDKESGESEYYMGATYLLDSPSQVAEELLAGPPSAWPEDLCIAVSDRDPTYGYYGDVTARCFKNKFKVEIGCWYHLSQWRHHISLFKFMEVFIDALKTRKLWTVKAMQDVNSDFLWVGLNFVRDSKSCLKDLIDKELIVISSIHARVMDHFYATSTSSEQKGGDFWEPVDGICFPKRLKGQYCEIDVSKFFSRLKEFWKYWHSRRSEKHKGAQ